MKMNSSKAKFTCRRGVTMIELVVAAVVMVVVMSLVTTLCFRISCVWQDTGHRRVAVAELSNQLDRLTQMSPQQVRDALGTLKPSELSKRTLRDLQLAGELFQSEIGHRIHLQLNWSRRHPGRPVELVGWIPLGSENQESGQ